MYRSFFLFSLGVHILLLAFFDTLVVSSLSCPPHPLKVTFLQKPLPLPVGETAQPAGGERTPTSSALEPEVLKKPPKPPAKTRKKPAPRPAPSIAKPLPKAEPLPPIDGQPTTGVGLGVAESSGSLDSNATVAAGGGSGGEGGGQRGDVGGTGPGGGGGRGMLARPDYGINPKPPYPLRARRMGAEGVVVLKVFVHEDGGVGEVGISQSSGFPILDEAARTTVQEQWRFLPARLDGKPVASWVEVPIHFVLEGW